MLSAWDKIEWRKGGVGIFGFDIMPDENGKMWLLEVNKCPTMEYSTGVTRKLVPKFMEDLTELIIDKRFKGEKQVKGLDLIYEVPELRDLKEYK